MRREVAKQARHAVAHTGVPQHLARRDVGRKVGAERAAGRDVRNDQRGQGLAVGRGEHDVVCVRREVREQPRAKRTDAHPRAGGQLEVLVQAAVESKSLGGIVRVHPDQGVAKQVVAFLVERSARARIVAPEPRSDTRTSQPRFESRAARYKLELHARHGQADHARACIIACHAQSERRALGGAEPGHHADSLTARLYGECLQLVPEPLPQPSRRIEQHLHPAEEVLAERGIAAKVRDEHLEASRHVEVRRGRDLAQIAHRRVDPLRRRPSLVDVERAAVVQHDAEVVAAAKDVVPRQPVAEHRRLLGEKAHHVAQHLLIGAEHAVRGDHPFRQSRRAGGEEDLGYGVWSDRGTRAVERVIRRRRFECLERRRAKGVRLPAGNHHLHSQRAHERQHVRERRSVLGEDEPWPQLLEHVSQRSMLARCQRVRGRDRCVWHADIHGREREQRVRDAVAREDRDGSLSRQVAPKQRLRDASHARERVGVRETRPVAIAASLGEERPIRRDAGPVLQSFGQRLRIGTQGSERPNVRGPVHATLDDRIQRSQTGGSHARRAVGRRAHPLTRAPLACSGEASSSRKVRPSRASLASSGAGSQRAPCSRRNAAIRSWMAASPTRSA